ncbi:hypothetical protein [Cryobacterium sp. TMB1-7]|uniref:hypothetical protein n=1 Tax=Cryobacterium sp. TMB1-7 TaxID=2555866 RepID=UPI001068D510|nr:hypothetical protein [Cryobacterium sp. TMB1-7]TFC61748.1 hypothetical protein E3O60_04215 [Cryobacterium sp. TMB1-7]
MVTPQLNEMDNASPSDVSVAALAAADAGSRTPSVVPRVLIFLGALAFVAVVAVAVQGAWGAIGIVIWAAMLIVSLGTVIVGVAVTTVIAPLAPVSEISVLGRRAVEFAKFALATAALFGTLLVGWMMNMTYESSFDMERFGQANEQMFQLLLLPVGVAAVVFWMWLSVDLLRIGKRRRRNAIDYLIRKLFPRSAKRLSLFRRLARDSMNTRLWIVCAFYIVPVVLFAGPHLFASWQ